MATIHYFDDTGEAYDASQCDDKIKDGDVLVGLDDQVVGFLFQAWPVAVTEGHGHFHTLKEDAGNLRSDDVVSGRPLVNYQESADAALNEYHRLEREGWTKPDVRPFTVAVYLQDRSYGGPEEGGWYYPSGEPADEYCDLTRGFKDGDEARAYAKHLNDTMGKTWNEGRRPTSSILSDGAYTAMARRGNPAAWPEVRPHYE